MNLQSTFFQSHPSSSRCEAAGGREKQLDEVEPYTTVPIMEELAGEKRRTTRIQRRGNFLDVGDEVTPGLPGRFCPRSE
ncbi:MAG: hypothetical protein R3C10_13610 [Pirellulales bacterium]